MAQPSEITFRELEIDNLDELLEWRLAVLRDVFAEQQPWDEKALLEANRMYYMRELGTGHRTFIASINGEDAGCGAVCLYEEMPSPDNLNGRCAYLMNIYTKPEFRRRGVARAIVQQLIEAAHEYDAGKIYLEASDVAVPLYRSCGFDDMQNMMKLE